jgi:hypothetical protein
LGTDAELSAAEPGRLRNLVAQRRPSPGSPKLSLPIRTAQSEPDTLMLKAIFWDQRRPLALINNATLGPNEEAQVRVAGTNVLVHCLSISPDSVRVQVAGAATNQTLKLKGR